MAMNDRQLDSFNQRLRVNPGYREFISRDLGIQGPLFESGFNLNDDQRKRAEQWVRSNVGDIGKLQIDPSGNANQDEGWSKHKKWAIPAAIGVGTLGLGAAGIGPAAGIFSSGGGAAAAGGATGVSGAAAPGIGLSSSGLFAPTAGIGAGAGTAAGGSMAGGILGTLGKALPWIERGADVFSGLGQVTSGAAKGSADQRLAEAYIGQRGAEFNREGQDRQIKQAILMQLLNNTQDFSATPGNPAIAARMGQVSGGARPSNLTTNREALMSLLGAPQIQAPTSEAGALESILGGVGLGSNILGAIGKLRQPKAA